MLVEHLAIGVTSPNAGRSSKTGWLSAARASWPTLRGRRRSARAIRFPIERDPTCSTWRSPIASCLTTTGCSPSVTPRSDRLRTRSASTSASRSLRRRPRGTVIGNRTSLARRGGRCRGSRFTPAFARRTTCDPTTSPSCSRPSSSSTSNTTSACPHSWRMNSHDVPAGIASLKRYWRIDTRQLQLLLYHRGQVSEFPALPSKRREPPLSDRPVMQALIDRWLDVRRLTLSPKTVDHRVVSLHHFMTHLARYAPEVRSFADLTRDQALGFVAAMAEDARFVDGKIAVDHCPPGAHLRRRGVLQGRNCLGLARYAEPAVARSQGYAADTEPHPALHSCRRIGSSYDGRRGPAAPISTRRAARRPLVRCASWRDLPARGRLPRRLPGWHSAAPHPGRQDVEGARRTAPRRSR
jgi:hypothetical protein